MTMVLLNVELVDMLMRERGLRRCLVLREAGMTRTAGYTMFREGLLPKDQAKRERALKVLSDKLGLNESELTVRLELAKESA